MKLIVGLGNPGKEYDDTRHNIGFRIIDAICNQWNISLDYKKMNSQYGKIKKNGEDIILLKPLTYMNLSGHSVQTIMTYFKFNIEDIIIIYDDIDLELGKIKMKSHGSSGGHNGVNSIINTLSSNWFKRIRIGIGKNKHYSTSDWVLSKFQEEEKILIESAIKKTVEIIEEYTTDFDFQKLMNKYN